MEKALDQSMTFHSASGAATNIQGPVVQSVVSFTSSLKVILLTVLADSIHNILIFFAEKMWVPIALQKLLIFFQQNISAYLRLFVCVEVLRPSQPNRVMSSAVSLPNRTFTGQA